MTTTETNVTTARLLRRAAETNVTTARLLRRAALAVSTLSLSAERDDTRHIENMELAAACEVAADALDDDAYDRWMLRNPTGRGGAHLKWDIDDAADFAFARAVYAKLYANEAYAAYARALSAIES